MPQTVNNENEYRLTRSKAMQSQGLRGNEGGPKTHAQTQTEAQSQKGGRGEVMMGDGNGETKEGLYSLSQHSSDEVLGGTRSYLGDVSNQYGSSGVKPNANMGSKRRPLGGDNAPLQQHQRIMLKPNNSSTNTNHLLASQPKDTITTTSATINDNTNGNITSNNHTTASSSNSSTQNLAVPARLPQKRQATESSTNLVEKLHISSHHSNNVSYKKSRIIDYEWQDLDEEDIDDPLMVSEYVNDIFPYLSELEHKTLPDSQYLFKQKHLKPKMRSILVDWLVEMHTRFRLLPETLFLAINIMDRFMSLEIVQIDKLQLLATGSLFIAAKYEEVFSPSVKNYAYFTDGSYTEDEILQAEKYILTILNFDLNYPNPMNFLRRISKADDYDVQSRTLGKYLLEITIIDYKFIGMLPSLCSASAMYIARLILGKSPVWNGNLIHYSGGYRVSDMKDCIELLVQYLIAPVEHDEFFKKYATRKFMKASILCRSWAKKIVSENKDIFANDLFINKADS
ncbi:uncharacterized protein AC631_03693 [Debaryomyces fabryi]|uniref:Uncharacterized protein n=1 Tax=Debaryomyces fabryi TaxID=58627 RepID=A0A0V1PWC1_9ASCO|nr:uncharacterized protein AC631_03693 [Debaryomyces fabryi]KSA00552.1 hypothetical protein AC631_03693 [Debaryomyces fabryi]CUM57028.1 unnamed protein product [Debaryomyces fabryi]